MTCGKTRYAFEFYYWREVPQLPSLLIYIYPLLHQSPLGKTEESGGLNKEVYDRSNNITSNKRYQLMFNRCFCDRVVDSTQ